jgi:hypothetical protein
MYFTLTDTVNQRIDYINLKQVETGRSERKSDKSGFAEHITALTCVCVCVCVCVCGLHLVLRLCAAIPPLPSTSSWRGA